MRPTIPGYTLLLLLILGFIYFIFMVPAFILALSANSNSKDNITVSVPKEAHIGEEIEVTVYYYPRFFKKDGLNQIIFFDSTDSYDYKESLSLYDRSSGKLVYIYTLGSSPFYKSFTYKIPQQVCPENIVYEFCKLVPTKTGKGTITLIHNPILSTFFGGEGYQGNGEKIEVPINIIKD